MTKYPSPGEYVEALQDPESAFRSPVLQRAAFVMDRRYPAAWGIPLAVSGNAAVVFRATVDSRDQALRFFVREDVSEKERYAALERHFVEHRMQDWVSRASWVDDAVALGGRRWPMVQMDWITGRRLDDHVDALAVRHDVATLHTLAANWRAHVRRVQNAEFAHGDLQHGNVLVEPSGGLRLVDFDGSWIAALDRLGEPKESGHLNYRHPCRRTWGRWMDTFPALVIYTGLLALSRRPDAWRKNEAILFTREDLEQPGATPTWQLLAEIADPEIDDVAQRLRDACRPEWMFEGDLEHLLRSSVSHAPRFSGVSSRPDLNWHLRPAPGRTGETRPTDAAPETTFAGVSGPSAPDPEPVRPPVVPPKPDTPVTAAALVVAAAIALTLGLIIGAAVGHGQGAAVGVITAIVAFACALPLLRRRL